MICPYCGAKEIKRGQHDFAESLKIEFSCSNFSLQIYGDDKIWNFGACPKSTKMDHKIVEFLELEDEEIKEIISSRTLLNYNIALKDNSSTLYSKGIKKYGDDWKSREHILRNYYDINFYPEDKK